MDEFTEGEMRERGVLDDTWGWRCHSLRLNTWVEKGHGEAKRLASVLDTLGWRCQGLSDSLTFCLNHVCSPLTGRSLCFPLFKGSEQVNVPGDIPATVTGLSGFLFSLDCHLSSLPWHPRPLRSDPCFHLLPQRLHHLFLGLCAGYTESLTFPKP